MSASDDIAATELVAHFKSGVLTPPNATRAIRGAVFLGKAATSEFSWKSLGDNPLTGITRNP